MNINIFQIPLFYMQPSIENIESISLKRKPRAVSTFLKKTFELLNEPQNSVCIKWAPNGIGFIVTNEDLFSKTVLPKYFKHSNYSSFVRQLNMYNFHKIRENNSESYFHHQCFDRDNKNAMSEIKRKPQKKKRKNDDSEDDRDQNESIPLRHRRTNHYSQSKEFEGRILSEERVSINLLKQDNSQQIKSQKHTKGHLFSQTYYCPEQQNRMCEQSPSNEPQDPASEKNILSVSDDDRLSINDEITERIPRFNTKQLFCPSTNNLFPFVNNIQPSTFSLFF